MLFRRRAVTKKSIHTTLSRGRKAWHCAILGLPSLQAHNRKSGSVPWAAPQRRRGSARKVSHCEDVSQCDTGRFYPRDYVLRSEHRLCEPALCVESLTVRSYGEKGGKGNEPSLFPRGLRSGERKVQVLRSCRRRRRLLWLVRSGHYGQGPQPLLRRTVKEAPPAGAAQTLRSLRSTQALPITMCS